MGKILFTKQEALKENDKVYVNIHQKIEYDEENIKNVLVDFKEQQKMSDEFLAKFDELEQKCYDTVKKTLDANMDKITEMLAMTEEEAKEKLYKDFIANKENMQKSLDSREDTLKVLLAKEKERLAEMKSKVLQECNQIKQASEMYSKALE